MEGEPKVHARRQLERELRVLASKVVLRDQHAARTRQKIPPEERRKFYCTR